MRILQIVHGFPPESIAGTETYCEALSRCLLERGHECMVLAGSKRSAPEATTSSCGPAGVATQVAVLYARSLARGGARIARLGRASAVADGRGAGDPPDTRCL